MKVSIIIPVYNEENVIGSCLESLSKQTIKGETIVVDDGSTDATILNIKNKISNSHLSGITLLEQKHLGPGAARNLAARRATEEILVFVDADMEFEPNFIEKLIAPILTGKATGTFSREEYLLNKNSSIARIWNLNLGRKAEKMHADSYPETQPVFRAILKDEFDKAGGFDSDIGYTDDWSLSRKLGVLAVAAPGAKYYHRNPETLSEVWKQARWFGKNEFLTKNVIRKIYNLIRYFPLAAPFKGIFGAINFQEKTYIRFKIIYDSAVFTSVVLSFLNESKTR